MSVNTFALHKIIFLSFMLPFGMFQDDGNMDYFFDYRILNSEIYGDRLLVENSTESQQILRDSSKLNLTLILRVFGENLNISMDILKPSAFVPQAMVTIYTNKTKLTAPAYDLAASSFYEGSDSKGNYAFGSVKSNIFTGVVMQRNGSVIYIEPLDKRNVTKHPGYGGFVAYKGGDVKFRNCGATNNSKTSCHESGFSSSIRCWREDRKRIMCSMGSRLNSSSSSPFAKDDTSKDRQRSHSTKNVTCPIQLVSDISHHQGVHNLNPESTLADMLTAVRQANHIISSFDFDGDGRPDNLWLRIRHVVMIGCCEEPNDNSTLHKKVTEFRERPQDDCLSLLFISHPLPNDIVSVTFGGGICKSNENEEEPAKNIAIINTKDSRDKTIPLFAVGWATTAAIGQVMGSLERDCESPVFYPSEDDWSSFFSDCQAHNIANTLQSYGSCLEISRAVRKANPVTKPKKKAEKEKLCGNGRPDAGEECDCGSPQECAKKSSCCIPPEQKNECKYNRENGYYCEWTESCCTRDCKIVPKSWNTFCGYGDPSCNPFTAYCDGETSKCPFPKGAESMFNGEMCGPTILKDGGAGTCRDGMCNSTVCRDGGLEDCTCDPSTRQQCRVCCRKPSRNNACLPAEYYGLRPKRENFYLRYPGTPCQEVTLGHCDKAGVCAQLMPPGLSQAAAQHLKLPKWRKFISILCVLWTVAWRTFSIKVLS